MGIKKQIMAKEFYMVFVADGDSPTVRHCSLYLAENEAKRLAELTGKKAYVLCSIKSFQTTKFVIEDLRSEQNLPF